MVRFGIPLRNLKISRQLFIANYRMEPHIFDFNRFFIDDILFCVNRILELCKISDEFSIADISLY